VIADILFALGAVVACIFGSWAVTAAVLEFVYPPMCSFFPCQTCIAGVRRVMRNRRVGRTVLAWLLVAAAWALLAVALMGGFR
jgi:hypothetical protein